VYGEENYSLSYESYKGVEGLLRVDRKLRTYGSDERKLEYYKRPPIEAVNNLLKNTV
jgi:hypothetical protein